MNKRIDIMTVNVAVLLLALGFCIGLAIDSSPPAARAAARSADRSFERSVKVLNGFVPLPLSEDDQKIVNLPYQNLDGPAVPDELRAVLAGQALNGLLADPAKYEMVIDLINYYTEVYGWDYTRQQDFYFEWYAGQAVLYADALYSALNATDN